MIKRSLTFIDAIYYCEEKSIFKNQSTPMAYRLRKRKLKKTQKNRRVFMGLHMHVADSKEINRQNFDKKVF